eukprot:Filipodium_phascolosomae@DN2245_c0_g1_i2.p1
MGTETETCTVTTSTGLTDTSIQNEDWMIDGIALSKYLAGLEGLNKELPLWTSDAQLTPRKRELLQRLMLERQAKGEIQAKLEQALKVIKNLRKESAKSTPPGGNYTSADVSLSLAAASARANLTEDMSKLQTRVEQMDCQIRHLREVQSRYENYLEEKFYESRGTLSATMPSARDLVELLALGELDRKDDPLGRNKASTEEAQFGPGEEKPVKSNKFSTIRAMHENKLQNKDHSKEVERLREDNKVLKMETAGLMNWLKENLLDAEQQEAFSSNIPVLIPRHRAVGTHRLSASPYIGLPEPPTASPQKPAAKIAAAPTSSTVPPYEYKVTSAIPSASKEEHDPCLDADLPKERIDSQDKSDADEVDPNEGTVTEATDAAGSDEPIPHVAPNRAEHVPNLISTHVSEENLERIERHSALNETPVVPHRSINPNITPMVQPAPAFAGHVGSQSVTSAYSSGAPSPRGSLGIASATKKTHRRPMSANTSYIVPTSHASSAMDFDYRPDHVAGASSYPDDVATGGPTLMNTYTEGFPAPIPPMEAAGLKSHDRLLRTPAEGSSPRGVSYTQLRSTTPMSKLRARFEKGEDGKENSEPLIEDSVVYTGGGHNDEDGAISASFMSKDGGSRVAGLVERYQRNR